MLWTPQPMLRLCMLPSTAPDLPFPPVAGVPPPATHWWGWGVGGGETEDGTTFPK